MLWIHICLSSFFFLLSPKVYAVEINYFPNYEDNIQFHRFQNYHQQSTMDAKLTASDVTLDLEINSKTIRDEYQIEWYSKVNSLTYWGIKTGYIFNEMRSVEPTVEDVPFASIDLYRKGFFIPEFIWWKDIPGSAQEFEQIKYIVSIMPNINKYSMDAENSSSLFGKTFFKILYSFGGREDYGQRKMEIMANYIYSEVAQNTLSDEITNYGSTFNLGLKRFWQIILSTNSSFTTHLGLNYFTEQKVTTELSLDTLFSDEFTIKPFYQAEIGLAYEVDIQNYFGLRFYLDYLFPYEKLYKTIDYDRFTEKVGSEYLIGVSLRRSY